LNRKGFTLLEVLLACSLILILIGCLFALVMPMMRTSERASRVSDLRQMAALSLAQICREVEQSAAPGIRLYQSETVLSVQSLEGLSADASSIWQKRVILFAYAGSQLRKIQMPPMPSGVAPPEQARPYTWEPSDLNRALALGGSLLCTDVVEFRISGRTTRGLRPPLLIRLAVRRDGSTFVLEQAVLPGVRNIH